MKHEFRVVEWNKFYHNTRQFHQYMHFKNIIFGIDRPLTEFEVYGYLCCLVRTMSYHKDLDIHVDFFKKNNFEDFSMNDACDYTKEFGEKILRECDYFYQVTFTITDRKSKSWWWRLCNPTKHSFSAREYDFW